MQVREGVAGRLHRAGGGQRERGQAQARPGASGDRHTPGMSVGSEFRLGLLQCPSNSTCFT